MKKTRQPEEWSDKWIQQIAQEHDLKVGYVEIGRPQDNPQLIDDYITKNKDGIEK